MKNCAVTDGYPAIVKRNVHLLCLLAKNDHPRKLILNAPADFLKCLSLIAFNVIHGKIPLDQNSTKRLTPYAKNFRAFARRSLSTKKRRATLLSAGFLPALLSILGSVIVPSIVDGITSSKRNK